VEGRFARRTKGMAQTHGGFVQVRSFFATRFGCELQARHSIVKPLLVFAITALRVLLDLACQLANALGEFFLGRLHLDTISGGKL
jgi:hypothetical protein